MIVVFGGVISPALPDRHYPDLGSAADRVWHAARLYHAGKAPRVLLSGGCYTWQPSYPTQAETMGVFLRDFGVPDSAILLETQSHSTRQNALFSAKQIQMHQLHKVLLVTVIAYASRVG